MYVHVHYTCTCIRCKVACVMYVVLCCVVVFSGKFGVYLVCNDIVINSCACLTVQL